MANPVLRTGQASPTSVFEASNTQQHELGARGVLGDRVFRYAKFVDSTACSRNKLMQMCPPVANHVKQTDTAFAPVANATSISITLGATDAQQDEYKDGYLILRSATNGVGQQCKLKGHAFVATGGVLTADIYDPIVTSTSGTEVYTLVHNAYSGVVIQPTSITAPAAGVCHVSLAACTTSTGTGLGAPLGYLTGSLSTGTYTYILPQYLWLQTWGICSVLCDTSTTVTGSAVIVGGTAGTLGVAVETDIKQRIGIAMEGTTDDAMYLPTFLQIAP